MVKYERIRQERMEENNKRLQQLRLPILSQALKTPKSSPKKPMTPRIAKTELVHVRRSPRVSKNPVTRYEVTVNQRIHIPRRVAKRRVDIQDLVLASDESRECAMKKAEKVKSSLGSDHPCFIRSMLPSHVSGGFWLGLSADLSRRTLPRNDGVVSLVDEQGQEWPVIYLARKSGLSGGWKKFAIDHGLADGDALVFQLIQATVLKVYIIKVDGSEEISCVETTLSKMDG